MCPQRIFIFDEVRKYPKLLFDVLVPYLDAGSPLSKPFRKSIFLMLYEGDKPVYDYALQLHKSDQKREDIDILSTEKMLMKFTYDDDSAMKGSRLLSKGLIDFHIPLLPLERRHVRQCIETSIKVCKNFLKFSLK